MKGSVQVTPLKTRVRGITRLLEIHLGIPRDHRDDDPLELLIETILSQNTNDRNRDRAFQALKERFPSWQDVLEARTSQVVRTIRSGGLARQKAKRIKEILRWIKNRFGRLSLSALQEMASEEIKDLFGNLPGIGPKTVHCLLLFGLGREAFPVDTHILRVGKRLGFIPAGMDAAKAHPWMGPLIPHGKALSLHINLIRLGRSLCKAGRPRCSACFVRSRCVHFLDAKLEY
jgi:endonuclease III